MKKTIICLILIILFAGCTQKSNNEEVIIDSEISVSDSQEQAVIDWAESISFSWTVYKNGEQWHKRDYYFRNLDSSTPDIRVTMYDYNTIDFLLLGSENIGYYKKSNDDNGWIMMSSSAEYDFQERWNFFDPNIEVAVYSESGWMDWQENSLVSEDEVYSYHYENVLINPDLSDTIFSTIE